jgi:hypothetical protein
MVASQTAKKIKRELSLTKARRHKEFKDILVKNIPNSLRYPQNRSHANHSRFRGNDFCWPVF